MSFDLIEKYQRSLPPIEECKRLRLKEAFANHFVELAMTKTTFTEEMLVEYKKYSTKFLQCVWYRFLLSWYEYENRYKTKKECPYFHESLNKDIIEMLKKKEEETEEEYIERYYNMILDLSELHNELSEELFYSIHLKNVKSVKNEKSYIKKTIKKMWNL